MGEVEEPSKEGGGKLGGGSLCSTKRGGKEK